MKLSPRPLVLILTILFSFLTLVACDSAAEQNLPEIPENFTRYQDQEIGISFDYPENWFFNNDPALYVIASDEALLSGPGAIMESQGSLVTIALAKSVAFGGLEDPAEILRGIIELSSAGTQGELRQDVTITEINGQPTASAEYLASGGDVPRIVRYVVMVRNDKVVTFITAMPESGETVIGPQIESVINSLVISPEN